MFESLHNHTTISDGEQSHLSLLAEAEAAGYSHIAFTDHDAFPSQDVLKNLNQYTGPVKWLISIELTSRPPRELRDKKKGSLHILGLFLNIEHPPLKKHLEKVQLGKINRVKHVVKQLQSIGLTISEDDCINAAIGSENVGTPHMVSAVLAHNENIGIIQSIADEMKAKSTTNTKLAKRYEAMLKEGGIERYPYTLFMKSDSFIPMPEIKGGTALLELDETVTLIREAGGIAILALWFTYKEIISEELLDNLLKEKRLDGVESDTLDLRNRSIDEIEADAQLLIRIAHKYGLTITNGADAHKIGDLEKWKQKQPLSVERSIGESGRLINDLNPDLKYSTF